jgi:hypothetical protein
MNEKNLSIKENYAIGATTGLTEVLVTHPLWVIKTKIQQNKSWLMQPSAYYRGVGTNALGFVPTTAIQLGAKEWLESFFFNHKASSGQQISAAFISGMLSSFISCPVEMMMTLQQNDNVKKFNLTHLLKTKGISVLFHGQVATTFKEGGFSVCAFALPPIVKPVLTSHGLNEVSSNIISGMVSGIIATIITHPLDSIKTLQQSSIDSKIGFFKTAKNLKIHEMFKGMIARSSLVILSITVMNWVKEELENQCINKSSLHQHDQLKP